MRVYRIADRREERERHAGRVRGAVDDEGGRARDQSHAAEREQRRRPPQEASGAGARRLAPLEEGHEDDRGLHEQRVDRGRGRRETQQLQQLAQPEVAAYACTGVGTVGSGSGLGLGLGYG